MKFFRSLLLCLLLYHCVSAQTDSLATIQSAPATIIKEDDTAKVFIATVSIYGNDKTKAFIINREIPFTQGEYVLEKDLPKKMEIAKEQLVNTMLFLDVSVYIENRYGQFVFITVLVKERWYIFPLPYFSLVDKNLNTWLVTYHHSLERVNYGIKFLHNNISGRNDKLTVWLITGYTRQVSLKYDRPYFDTKLKNGYNIAFNFTQQRELNYGTYLSKQQFLKPEDLSFVRKGVFAEADYVYRPALRSRHIFSLYYYYESVADTILEANPNYLPNNQTKISFPQISYTYQYFGADYNAYPTKGLLGQASITHRGIDNIMNLTQLQLISSYTLPVLPKTQIQFKEGAVLGVPFNQPFYNERLFGYGGIFMQGLEYYVIDGVAGYVEKTTLQHEFLDFSLKLTPRKNQSYIVPFRFFGKIYSDLGYAYNKNPGNSLLNNKMLYSYGFGVDMITTYDLVFKFEYSFNQLGQSGLFIHVRTDF